MALLCLWTILVMRYLPKDFLSFGNSVWPIQHLQLILMFSSCLQHSSRVRISFTTVNTSFHVSLSNLCVFCMRELVQGYVIEFHIAFNYICGVQILWLIRGQESWDQAVGWIMSLAQPYPVNRRWTVVSYQVTMVFQFRKTTELQHSKDNSCKYTC